MPHYRAVIPSPWSPDRVLRYLADFSNAAEWDPGVLRAAPVTGDGAAAPAFDLVVRVAGREVPLRYVVTERSDRSVTLRALTRLLRSEDTVTVRPDGDGSAVQYDATLGFRGVARILDPLLAPAFTRIARRADEGLRRRLRGAVAT